MFVAMTSNIVKIGINKYTNIAEIKRLSKNLFWYHTPLSDDISDKSPRQKALINSMDNCVFLIDGP